MDICLTSIVAARLSPTARPLNWDVKPMIANSRRSRVPLRSALRKYWPCLAVLFMASAANFAYPGAKEHPSLLAAAFFVGAFVAMVPWLFFDAPY